MLKLEARELGWISEEVPSEEDRCAHGAVRLEAGGVTFAAPDECRVTMNMAGLHLLRTLDRNHTQEDRVCGGDPLLPHCAIDIYPDSTNPFGFISIGCPSGIEFDVVHDGDDVTLRCAAGAAVVPLAAWRAAVVAFCDAVQALYDRSPPKSEPEEHFQREGWRLFWEEWRRRLDAARAAVV
jgi:hypothetical protein